MEANEKKPNRHLRRERDLKGWSQKTLAEKVGTNEQVANRWENGKYTPNRYFQTQLCQLFGKNAQELGFMDDPQSEIAEQESQTDLEQEKKAEDSVVPSQTPSVDMRGRARRSP
jgi:DNA-binding XRE family transcriptional regulator